MNPRLDKAQERLEAALARIDSALERGISDDGAAQKLKILTDEHVALRSRQQEISTQLDTAIDRLQRVLKD